MDTTLLRFQVWIQRVITQREAMIAANKVRESRGEGLAYDEAAFEALCSEFASIEEHLRNL